MCRLEEGCRIRHEKDDQALNLAREILQNDIKIAREGMSVKLDGMNQFQKRIDRLEGTFATKDDLSEVKRLVYIGVGIIIALEFAIKYIK